MTLYTTACVACPPLGAAMVPFWPTAEHPSSLPPGMGSGVGMASLPPGMGVGLADGAGSLQEAYVESMKRNTFYISDILYPSVIPLPGTLPQGPSSTPVRTSPHGSPSSSSSSSSSSSPSSSCSSQVSHGSSPGDTPSPPKVRSSDLKFGIDRILQTPTRHLKPTKDSHQDQEGSGLRYSRTPCSASQQSVIKGDPTSPSFCPCSSAGPTILSYPIPIPYPPPPPAHSGSHRHPSSQTHQLGFGHIHGHHSGSQGMGGPGTYPSSRPSEFPGPYAVLSAEPHSHQGTAPSKRKRSWSRAVFSHLQRKGLEKRFEVQKYVTKPDRRQLAAMLGLTDAQVKVWFQNRRMKWRHAEEAKRKKSEDDDQTKEEGSSTTTEKKSSNSNEGDKSSSSGTNPTSESQDETGEGLEVEMVSEGDHIWTGDESEDSDLEDDQSGALIVDIDQ